MWPFGLDNNPIINSVFRFLVDILTLTYLVWIKVIQALLLKDLIYRNILFTNLLVALFPLLHDYLSTSWLGARGLIRVSATWNVFADHLESLSGLRVSGFDVLRLVTRSPRTCAGFLVCGIHRIIHFAILVVDSSVEPICATADGVWVSDFGRLLMFWLLALFLTTYISRCQSGSWGFLALRIGIFARQFHTLNSKLRLIIGSTDWITSRFTHILIITNFWIAPVDFLLQLLLPSNICRPYALRLVKRNRHLNYLISWLSPFLNALLLLGHTCSLPKTLFLHTKSKGIFFVRAALVCSHQIVDDHTVILLDLLNLRILVLYGKRSLNNRRLTPFKRCQTVHLLDLLFTQNLWMLICQRQGAILMLVALCQYLILLLML